MRRCWTLVNRCPGTLAKSVPLGKNCRIRPLVFSFVPRCHAQYGFAKKIFNAVSIANCSCSANSLPLPPIVGEVAARTSCDFVGRPTPPQAFPYIATHFRPLQLADPRSPTTARLSLPVGRYRPVTVAAAITPQFAGDGALAPAQALGNLRLHLSRPVHVGYDLTLFQSKMTCHRGDSFRMGPS